MWKKAFQNRVVLAIAAGISVFLAFPNFSLVPLIVLFPVLFTLLTLRCQSALSGFLCGFLTSLVIMLGGFYWVTYVIHEFGYLPWAVAVLLYLGFCGFGALNFPLFASIAVHLHRKIEPLRLAEGWQRVWFVVLLPALFTVIEFAIPKLFPWYIGHSLYRARFVTQIVEITGCTFLSFVLFSTGSAAAWLLVTGQKSAQSWVKAFAFPLVLWMVCIVFSMGRLGKPAPEAKNLRVALIQANIGSLEKAGARQGLYQKVRFVVDKYSSFTERALLSSPKPDLIVWPETAMPFQLHEGLSSWSREIRSKVQSWKVPLVTGAYAPGGIYGERDYNAAFLLEPRGIGVVTTQLYEKNILLAFGEYLPLGDWFPLLYALFPQVSHFERGTEQKVFELSNGTRLGVTICYEAIVPSFYRKVASQNVNAVLNLTNDSWFGPTSEPHQHGALSVFRAIETRVPLIRIANTGASFIVDETGKMSRMTPVYDEDILISDVRLPLSPKPTFYLRFGDWFALLLGCVLVIAYYLTWKNHASLSC